MSSSNPLNDYAEKHTESRLTLSVPAHVYIREKNCAQVTRPCIYTFWTNILFLWPWDPKQCAIFVAQVFFGN